MLKVGLTGSIAMGKSTTADMFRRLGHPVFDADTVVHDLYQPGGGAVAAVASLFPDAVVDGAVDRDRLGAIVLSDKAALSRLEAAVHPLVRREQREFLHAAEQQGAPFVILDIPLLFETGQTETVDVIVVVSAPQDVQRQRALERPGMTGDKLDDILVRQTPDAKKRAAADYVVDTGRGLEDAFEQVRRIADDLTARAAQKGSAADA